MSRRKGQRSEGFDDKRAALLGQAARRLTAAGATHPSLRELAAACDVTLPTLKHYFGRRDDVVKAVLVHQGEQGRSYVTRLARTDLAFRPSIEEAVGFVLAGLRAGVAEIVTMGLVEGLRHPSVGPEFLGAVIDPIVDAMSARCSLHMARGEMRDVVPRHAALFVIAPLVLAALHQLELGGEACNPMDLDALAASLVDAFVAAFAADEPRQRTPPRTRGRR